MLLFMFIYLPCNHCSNWTWVVEEILALWYQAAFYALQRVQYFEIMQTRLLHQNYSIIGSIPIIDPELTSQKSGGFGSTTRRLIALGINWKGYLLVERVCHPFVGYISIYIFPCTTARSYHASENGDLQSSRGNIKFKSIVGGGAIQPFCFFDPLIHK